jgi:hypothetical protein
MGDGVQRQVLSEALQYCLDQNICEVVNQDGYVSLKTSSFVSSPRLDLVFAFGVLSAMFLVKVQTGPDPLSPALLQAAIGGFESLKDLRWVSVVFPDIAREIALMPKSHGLPTPQNIQDRQRLSRLVESRMSTSVCHDFIPTCMSLTLRFKYSCLRLRRRRLKIGRRS